MSEGKCNILATLLCHRGGRDWQKNDLRTFFLDKHHANRYSIFNICICMQKHYSMQCKCGLYAAKGNQGGLKQQGKDMCTWPQRRDRYFNSVFVALEGGGENYRDRFRALG